MCLCFYCQISQFFIVIHWGIWNCENWIFFVDFLLKYSLIFWYTSKTNLTWGPFCWNSCHFFFLAEYFIIKFLIRNHDKHHKPSIFLWDPSGKYRDSSAFMCFYHLMAIYVISFSSPGSYVLEFSSFHKTISVGCHTSVDLTYAVLPLRRPIPNLLHFVLGILKFTKFCEISMPAPVR